jgi:histidinol dehydrogenase
MPGVLCWRKSVPIEKVGLYIPGGTAPLFSSVLMLGIPAKIAGCHEIILCSPPQKDGNIHPAILFAAHITGITRIFKVGGAQAIAAMAFGTETIPAVYKITGPGNRYVTEAKQMITKFGVAIDMPAGPSEVLVFADEGANPSFVAADLLSQAEHGEDSQVVLICPHRTFYDLVEVEIEKQLKILPRREIAVKALENSIAIAMTDSSSAMALINDYAPEHLIMALRNPTDFVKDIRNAGSVFLGDFTPEAAGDYASGTNHTLPTNGFAKAFSGVSVDSFIKKITFQQVSANGLEKLGPVVATMAAAEQLEAHRQAILIRLENKEL